MDTTVFKLFEISMSGHKNSVLYIKHVIVGCRSYRIRQLLLLLPFLYSSAFECVLHNINRIFDIGQSVATFDTVEYFPKRGIFYAGLVQLLVTLLIIQYKIRMNTNLKCYAQCNFHVFHLTKNLNNFHNFILHWDFSNLRVSRIEFHTMHQTLLKSIYPFFVYREQRFQLHQPAIIHFFSTRKSEFYMDFHVAVIFPN